MAITILENKKDDLELEFDGKELPNALLDVLLKKGVDAYAYDPHPLLPGYRLHIRDKNPKNRLKDSLKIVDKEWNDFGNQLLKGLGARKIAKKKAKPAPKKKAAEPKKKAKK